MTQDDDTTTSTSYYNADGADDIITVMPGLDEDSCSLSATSCGFNQYSGYLMATNEHEIHYWFIEVDSEEEAVTKPVFFWTNGGPGCSGMDGLLTEMGPWRVNDDLSISYNPYSWTTEVNMVFLEQPYGVGFSVVDQGQDVVAGDLNAANDMDAVIRNFLTKFPQFEDSEIYTSAESWGGHYVPMPAYTILQNNEAGYTPYINYKGFLLGNPYTDWYENTYGFIGDVYGHGLMDGPDYDKWREICRDNEDNVDSAAICSAIYSRAYISSINSNVYALDWPQCVNDIDWSEAAMVAPFSSNRNTMNNKQTRARLEYQKSSHLHRHAQRFMNNVLEHKNYEELGMRMDRKEFNEIYTTLKQRQFASNRFQQKEKEQKENKLMKHGEIQKMEGDTEYYSISGAVSGDSSQLSYLPCIEDNMFQWLNTAEVQEALHVKTPSDAWQMCSDAVWDAWPDSDYDLFMQDYYAEIIENYSQDLDLKLCIYSGDDDSVCGLTGTQYWLARWDGFEADSTTNWTPWADDDSELGGYYTIYHQEGNTDFNALHFITVRTAGHMVPTTQPARALTLLKKYLYELSNTN